MLKFFRRLRRRFLTKGKLNKYLFYAAGEILLVVLGILIAVQINKKNQQSADLAKEKIYLKSLYEELLQDSITFEHVDQTLQRIERSARIVNEVLENEDRIISDSLGFLQAIRNMIGQDYKFPEPIVWKELQYTGNLRLIRNRNLIKILYAYYYLLKENEIDYQNNAHVFILEGRYFDSATFTVEDQDDYFDNWEKDKVSSIEVFNRILNDKDFNHTTKGIITGMLITRLQLKTQKEELKTPLNILRKELQE